MRAAVAGAQLSDSARGEDVPLVEHDGGPAHVVTLLQGEDWASEVTVDDDAVVFAVNDADRVGRALPGLLASANLTLREYRPALFTLEDAFVRLTEEDR